MKVRLTVERDGTPLFSTIFEVMNGDITVGTPAALILIGVEAFVGAHHLSRKLDAWSRLGGHRLSQHRCC